MACSFPHESWPDIQNLSLNIFVESGSRMIAPLSTWQKPIETLSEEMYFKT